MKLTDVQKQIKEILKEDFGNGLSWAVSEGAMEPEGKKPLYEKATQAITALMEQQLGKERDWCMKEVKKAFNDGVVAYAKAHKETLDKMKAKQ